VFERIKKNVIKIKVKNWRKDEIDNISTTDDTARAAFHLLNRKYRDSRKYVGACENHQATDGRYLIYKVLRKDISATQIAYFRKGAVFGLNMAR
jgi:hypothetical protein